MLDIEEGSVCMQVFMLSVDGELDTTTLQAVLDSGHSRIPIHRGSDRYRTYLQSQVFLFGVMPAGNTPRNRDSKRPWTAPPPNDDSSTLESR